MTRLELTRGDTLDLVIGPVLDESGAVQDLTGSTIRFTAKDRLDDLDADAVLTGSSADGRITIPTQSGTDKGYAFAAIPGSATAGFATDRVLHWDVQVSQPSGMTKTLDDGILFVKRDVTRAT